ncbi:uncharacterized protein MELLADRAFT_69229 [Melampsora larici-populina 98AG31]|uniref:Uncharacterized protein n=1 Tax=Melampsora larici-populina (strain 98AG31 / pathotype 3-4-7) TaxID=747676 RepID=F4S9W1_MELLP|nr:uncharacterized protein MELLADRAFT_69229 [Melampsora larici-populina 98AG31]EGF98588.1 hypothetical protein MELLADRAFT_69229 [Melampsora larici-populina 98AG31]
MSMEMSGVQQVVNDPVTSKEIIQIKSEMAEKSLGDIREEEDLVWIGPERQEGHSTRTPSKPVNKAKPDSRPLIDQLAEALELGSDGELTELRKEFREQAEEIRSRGKEKREVEGGKGRSKKEKKGRKERKRGKKSEKGKRSRKSSPSSSKEESSSSSESEPPKTPKKSAGLEGEDSSTESGSSDSSDEETESESAKGKVIKKEKPLTWSFKKISNFDLPDLPPQ